ncbi:MAG TPA: tetratricopeptide repeat protein, partial [Vicinamibacterales bacterium]|nr:tetratricopeptide repeat protein [Vicinamibacterales bacterium]
QGAEESYRRAIQLDRNHADAHFFYADLLFSTGRAVEAEAEATCARKLDPLNFLFECFHGWHLVYLGRYDQAIAQLTKTLETEPNYPAAHLGLWGAFYKKDEHASALRAARTFFRLLGDEHISNLLPIDGDKAEYSNAMERAAETLSARAEHQHVPALRIARLYAHAGAKDEALTWLERACELHEAPLVHLQVAWDWDCLREQPRFRTLLRQVNFPALVPQS